MVLLVHAVATWFMVGLIWFVQLVHYPLFAQVGQGGYATYQRLHMQRTSWVVGPVMVIEGITGIGLLWQDMNAILLWSGLGLLGLIWLSTALLQVPRHNRLLRQFDGTHHRVLVLTNWVRTIAWTVRGILVFFMVSVR